MFTYSCPEGKKFESEALKAGEILAAVKMLKGAVAAMVDGVPVDLDVTVDHDAEVAPVSPSSEEGLDIVRHSTAHLLAEAVMHLYPGAKVAIGPTIKDGFYYDIEFPKPISDADLPAIEKEMKKISKHSTPVKRQNVTKEEAVALFKERNEP